MRDLSDMEIGQVVDYVEEYNRVHYPEDDKPGKKKPEKVTKRKATQADWDAFFG